MGCQNIGQRLTEKNTNGATRASTGSAVAVNKRRRGLLGLDLDAHLAGGPGDNPDCGVFGAGV